MFEAIKRTWVLQRRGILGCGWLLHALFMNGEDILRRNIVNLGGWWCHFVYFLCFKGVYSCLRFREQEEELVKDGCLKIEINLPTSESESTPLQVWGANILFLCQSHLVLKVEWHPTCQDNCSVFMGLAEQSFVGNMRRLGWEAKVWFYPFCSPWQPHNISTHNDSPALHTRINVPK